MVIFKSYSSALRIGILFILGAVGLLSSPAKADWSLLPESRHHLYQSYSFFIEQHNTIVSRGSNQFWAAVSATLPIAGNNDSPAHPQFLFHFSGNDSMHTDSNGGVYTETLDTRVGLLYEFSVPKAELQLSIGFLHESGHVADGINSGDIALFPTNLGLNVLRIRVLHDFDKTVRVGLTLDPITHSIPNAVETGLNEFVEYFPWGSNEAEKYSPFVAAGLAHALSFSSAPLFHIQAGITLGAHFDPKHSTIGRLVYGYYTGPDPRAKYAEFLGGRSQFSYLGLMFCL